jgi:hypothetical protein
MFQGRRDPFRDVAACKGKSRSPRRQSTIDVVQLAGVRRICSRVYYEHHPQVTQLPELLPVMTSMMITTTCLTDRRTPPHSRVEGRNDVLALEFSPPKCRN